MRTRLKRFVTRSLSLIGIHPAFETERYWEQRYAAGLDSGRGTEGFNHEFKRDYVDKVIRCHRIGSVVDLGCGDGRQLFDVVTGGLPGSARLAEYHGIDVSPTAVTRCRELYRGFPNCRFDVATEAKIGKYDLAVSLDVIYHIVEYEKYVDYLKTLFGCSNYVLLYANREAQDSQVAHIVFRDNLAEIEKLNLQVELLEEEPHPRKSTSFFLFRTL